METTSIKSYEEFGYKEVVKRSRRDDEWDTSKGHPNNEHTASRQHDLVQTGLECNTRDIPVIDIESLDDVRGSGKGLREGKHMIPQTLPIVSSMPDRKMKCGVFNSCASRINRDISGQDKVMFEIEEHMKGLELNGQLTVVPADSIDSWKNVTILESAVRAANKTYFLVFDNTRTSIEIVVIVSFVFVLIFVHKFCSKECKNVVELKGVEEPQHSDTKRKGGIVNDGEKKIDSLDQATSLLIEATNENMFTRNLLTPSTYSDLSKSNKTTKFFPLEVNRSQHNFDLCKTMQNINFLQIGKD